MTKATYDRFWRRCYVGLVTEGIGGEYGERFRVYFALIVGGIGDRRAGGATQRERPTTKAGPGAGRPVCRHAESDR